jgi:thiol:disulfide interchange protein DsbD
MVTKNNNTYQLSFMADELDNAEFIPDVEGTIIDINDQKFIKNNGKGFLTLTADPYAENTDTLGGLLQLTKNGKIKTFSFSTPIKSGSIIPPIQNTPPQTDMTLLIAIIFAFIAGLILNLMPCVLPVLFLKIMGLVHHAHGKYNKTHLLSFLLGVLIPFWGLGTTLILLKQAGESLGWGFHLQSPAFIGVLIIIMLLITLNLFGVFELGTSLTRAGSKLKSTDGHSGSFASGVLMTIVATPCTVPFMGGAMAYGLSQTTTVALAIFTSLGVGMAAPYMFLALIPKALKIIPKPGAWMETFRKILGLPMLLTAFWLYWVFGQQVTEEGSQAFAFALLVVVFASWLFGCFAQLQNSTKQKSFASIVMVGALLFAGYFAFSAEKQRKQSHDNLWQEWSQERLEAELNAGNTVFIDFTADWCITCQVIDKTVLSLDKTQKLFKDNNIVLLKADWTLYDENITKALDSYGRKGVPLYVIHKKGNPQGIILPQIITYSVIEDGLAD